MLTIQKLQNDHLINHPGVDPAVDYSGRIPLFPALGTLDESLFERSDQEQPSTQTSAYHHSQVSHTDSTLAPDTPAPFVGFGFNHSPSLPLLPSPPVTKTIWPQPPNFSHSLDPLQISTSSQLPRPPQLPSFSQPPSSSQLLNPSQSPKFDNPPKRVTPTMVRCQHCRKRYSPQRLR